MKTRIKLLLASLITLIMASCTGVTVTSLETEYGTFTTNLDGSQSFTTKPGEEMPPVIGTIDTTQGTITVNPDGSYTFTSKPPVVEDVTITPTK